MPVPPRTVTRFGSLSSACTHGDAVASPVNVQRSARTPGITVSEPTVARTCAYTPERVASSLKSLMTR